jgi:Uma2 family endonuclease
MSALRETYYTPEQYLELERKAEFRSEYRWGQIVAMAGASKQHTRIATNIGGELRNRLKGGPCEAFATDLRVQISDSGLYTYPDVIVVCGEAILADSHADMLLNPTAIFEVLSPSTELYDRGEKFLRYQAIRSLTEYVLVSQDKYLVEHYSRQPDGDWLLHIANDVDEAITLRSLGCSLPLVEVYDRVVFEDPAQASD